MADDEVALVPLVADVAFAVRPDAQGNFAIGDDALFTLATRVAEADDKKTVALHLIALSVKFERTAAQNTKLALAQIAVLLGLALGGLDEAEKALGKPLGHDVGRVVGTLKSLVPVGAQGRPAGSVSALSARLTLMTDANKRKKEQKEEE